MAGGEAGSPVDELPPGDYKIVLKTGAREIVAPRVNVTLGQEITLRLVMKEERAGGAGVGGGGFAGARERVALESGRRWAVPRRGADTSYLREPP